MKKLLLLASCLITTVVLGREKYTWHIHNATKGSVKVVAQALKRPDFTKILVPGEVWIKSTEWCIKGLQAFGEDGEVDGLRGASLTPGNACGSYSVMIGKSARGRELIVDIAPLDE
jgi:hypothetical protein